MPSIVNVSNRLPVTVGEEISKSSGGLVSAMEGLSGEDGDLRWIGWPGAAVENPRRESELKRTLERDYGCIPVFLTGEEVSLYYHGFSNSSLWPVLHYMPNFMRHESAWWESYRTVNAKFADAVVAAAGPDDIVWVHDYHFMLLPEMIRARRPELRIGFFLHTPFPSYEVFRCHPQREELLRGLLGADRVGFHTFGYLRHFRSAVLRILGIEPEMGLIMHDGRATQIGVYPIGINAAKFEEELDSDALKRQVEVYREHYKGRRLVLSVERLDYTKGILHRLAAIDRFLETYHDRDRVCFVMISVPSRGEVPEYRELRDEVEQLVGKINGRHATVDNIPVHFLFQSVDFTQLCALYCLAEIGMVTPLIDGMNLVAKEYVACKKTEPGVLILSEFAGAAEELFAAIKVNPYDVNGVADELRRALELPAHYRAGRLKMMRERVLKYDARHWAKTFISDLKSHDVPEGIVIEGAKARSEIVSIARTSEKPWAFCLDYDGTLREFERDPDQASPARETREMLRDLVNLSRADVFLVSGRREDDLQKWFGDFPVTLVAEHGMRVRHRGQSRWEDVVPGIDLSWKGDVQEVFEHYEDSTPGSWIEVKRSTVVWHYRRSDPEFGRWKANQLVGELSEVISNLPVEIHHGKAIVEVSSLQVSKGSAMDRLLGGRDYGLILCAGDDQTDETMFSSSVKNLLSVKVGTGTTAAGYRIRNPGELRSMLRQIIELDSARKAHAV